MKKHFIEAPAPTPNGKLHLGHLSGPYIAADVFNRAKQLEGDATFFVCDFDYSQTYVRLAALKNNMALDALLEENIKSIKNTFTNYDIGFDILGVDNLTERQKFIKNFMSPLLVSTYVYEKKVEFFYDEIQRRFLIEAFISGLCSKCNNPTKGGACELCGYYNFSTDIINPFATLNPQTVLTKKSCSVYMLKTKQLLPQLIKILNAIKIDEKVRELIDKILSTIPDEFPVTLPLEDGIILDNDEMIRLTPWLEVLGGTYYLKNIARNNLNYVNFEEIEHTSFIGIDNTFYCIIIYNLVRICLGVDDFPNQYLVNRFYLKNTTKFSTSRNNAIWADDVYQANSVNELRLFLAFTHPGLDTYEFDTDQMEDFFAMLEQHSWANRIISYLKNNPNLSSEKDYSNPNLNAQMLIKVIEDKPITNWSILSAIQVICPSLSKKIVRAIRQVPQIGKYNSASFKNEFGVQVNRLIYFDENNFSSSIAKVDCGQQTTPHSHDTIDEIFYIINGEGFLRIDDSEINISGGDYIYVPAGKEHTIWTSKTSSLQFITIAWKI